MPYNDKPLVRAANSEPAPQYYNETVDSYEVLKGSNGAIRALNAGRATHVSVETNATTTEGSSAFAVDFVVAIVNDGTSDIKINFDASTASAGTITLKPGEVLSDFPRTCSTLYYKSTNGTQPFRAWGVR